jgi:hypothetical protein
VKMTESHRVLDVRGSFGLVGAASARSGCGLDQGARGQREHTSQHRVHVAPSRAGECRDRLSAPLGPFSDWLAGLGDGPMGPSS